MRHAAPILENPMLAAAAENARHGFPVYPAAPRDKRPLHKGWQRAATAKVPYLVKVWAAHPESNVGIFCRDAIVIDADSRRGEDAVADLGLPPTPMVRTARGSHLYFAGHAPTIPTLLPDVELRGKGSGVLGAGSVHPSGVDYEWEIAPWDVPLVPIPDPLRELIAEHRDNTLLRPDERLGAYIFRGRRNNYLTKMAGGLRGRYGLDDLAPFLHLMNVQHCRPPLAEAEVEKIAKSASRWAYPPLWVVDPVTYCADPKLSTMARVVLRALCDHAQDDGRCYPGVRRLRELTGSSPNTILKAIAELERKRRITVERGGRTKPNRYQLLGFSPFATKGGSSVTHAVTPPAHGAGAGHLQNEAAA